MRPSIVRYYFFPAQILITLVALSIAPPASAQTLEQELSAENPDLLAKAARELGDARRGAILFYQPHMGCTSCHFIGKQQNGLGPDLTTIDRKTLDTELIDSVLRPSKIIKQGFETVTVVTTAGKTLNGLLVNDGPKEIQLRDISANGKLISVRRTDIDEQLKNMTSIMPTGQVNGLASRQQFLDLMKYLMEIRDGELAHTKELEPPSALYAARPLPEYEKNIDHAGIIASWDRESFKRGEAIYNRLCINCHGNHDRPGSLPTSLRFATGKFKNGNDPLALYSTLTRGFGMMSAQTWMVPQQKYDVIHYVREAYLKSPNRSQYFPVDQAYLARLPKGTTRGPKPSEILPWEQMDYGPNLIATYEIGNDGSNFAYKGNAVRLDPGPGGVSQGRAWMIFDYDTFRVAAAWTGKDFIDWNGINFNGVHAIHPRIVGNVHFTNDTGPGWANPANGSFQDVRSRGRDGRAYGPLPREWADYKGMYDFGNRVIVSYTVGETPVLEMPGLQSSTRPNITSGSPTVTDSNKDNSATTSRIFTRTFNVGPRRRELILRVADLAAGSGRLKVFEDGDSVAFTGPSDAQSESETLVAGIFGGLQGTEWTTSDGSLRLTIPAGSKPVKFMLWLTRATSSVQIKSLPTLIDANDTELNLATLTNGSPPRWRESVKTTPLIGNDDGPFAVDVLTHPHENPWFCRMRLTGFDFFADGNRAAVCSWDGSVWLVSGLAFLSGDSTNNKPTAELTWKRIASGLFQPLGLKIVDGHIYVNCRDQICILHDLNGNGETDFYENFNNDHQVTEHFHEFAMGLQTDAEGDFYYAKSARHALTAIVPQHGTLLRVSKDGTRTDILANGFRAANGVCVNPDGTFFVTDQEGHWNPKNRINWVREGGFYGNMFGYHNVTDSSDAAMEQPLCWITNAFDRSPSELLWVDSAAWGPFNRSLLNFSYGYGKVYIVPHENLKGQMQGGMCALPIPQFPTGVMRGRFHPTDDQLYTCGMFEWAGTQEQPGGFYRIRYTGKPAYLPLKLNAKKEGMAITFDAALDISTVKNAEAFQVKVWSLKRTADYGSKHYSERPLKVNGVTLSENRKTVFLKIPDLQPTWCMEINYMINTPAGKTVHGVIHNTVHTLQ